ncbi:carbohydrate ABC transporter permease [Brachybacterium alimentarium]|uniref:Sugar ABC transporter permease n=1 Tax=Brachybacterium alimentarium TaxID=47845 RepID=A0A2A3YJK1_9MICO|nr:sugar ABC transporter permease [Brachybacterium alimentarium]PCC39458.1 sugar ABC transporter permease [Brachybacterium alimentarium]RCS77245.1 sugar ABC transporter permease [Brachybacterium alimentarium]RCS77700.1 sugar ABC transporter permease [Brachybacterium alimentarium]RCS79420.1 sugar ABC transporter permease [Brachybacterium alimentarium]RCS88136.1 sugar ABC transporter permease [Brachybacterium alimentarium]
MTATTTQATPREASTVRRRRGGPRAAESRWGLILAAPAALHTLIWIGIPIIVAFVLSMTAYDVVTSPQFNGFANYAVIFQDTIFWKAVLHNVIIAGVGIPISMFLALVFATMLNRAIPGRGIFRVMVFLPHITATVAVAMIWLWIYSPSSSGLMNTVLGLVGIGPLPYLTSPKLALASVILVTIWQGIGLKMLIYLASLQGIDEQLYEASSIDGANFIQKFRHITVPMLRPATFFILVTSLIANFQTFDLIYILTEGGPANATNVVTYRIYQTAFQEFRFGLASAQSVILLLMLIVLTFFSRRIVGGTDGD